MDSAEQVLWDRWRNGQEPAARDALILMHSAWARRVARDVFMRVYLLRDAWQDCTQNALVGLIQAIDRFDHDREVSFQTYARYRIRGAVFNGLRDLRESLAQGAAAYDRRDAVLERIGSFDGGDASDPLTAFVNTTVGLGLGFLLETTSFPGNKESSDAYAELEKEELSTCVIEGVERLGEREQLIVTLHYYHHLSFVEIAARLGVTKGRVSQLHKSALERLRLLLGTAVFEDS